MKLLREREQKRVELATQIADVRLEDYKINFPLRGGGEKRKEEKRRYGEERRTERERERGKGRRKRIRSFLRCRSNHDQLIRAVISANCFH